MYRAVRVTKSEANKILEVFYPCQCQLLFFIMYNGFLFYEKVFFYILTAFSSFTENVSINFEPKNFKSLIMLLNCVRSSRPKPFQGVQQEKFS